MLATKIHAKLNIIEHFYSAKIPSIEKARSIFKIGRFIFFVIEYRIMSMRTAKKKKIKI